MDVEKIELSHIKKATENLKEHPELIYKTPLIKDVQLQLKDLIPPVKSLALKLESMQCTGNLIQFL